MARFDEDGDRLYPCEGGVGWDTRYGDHVGAVDHRYPLHEGEYDPDHWGELNPDAYDRMGYEAYLHSNVEHRGHGRHLLHTGVE